MCLSFASSSRWFGTGLGLRWCSCLRWPPPLVRFRFRLGCSSSFCLHRLITLDHPYSFARLVIRRWSDCTCPCSTITRTQDYVIWALNTRSESFSHSLMCSIDIPANDDVHVLQ